MKKLIILIIVVVTILSCKSKDKNADTKGLLNGDSTLVTDTSWGYIHKSLNYSDLKVIFGEENIKDERICGAECIDSIDVTKIYPDKGNEIIIYWQDSAYHKKIGNIESFQDKSPYHTSSAIKIGSTLQDILQLNGQKITFSGFGWDYGGYIHSYNNGKLEKSPIKYRLDLTGGDYHTLYGDTELDTDMPEVKKMLDKIAVYNISLSF